MAGVEMSGAELVDQWQTVMSGVTLARRQLDRTIEHSGVPAQWFAVLRLLLIADEHRLPMSVLARELSMTPGGFTKLADRMARNGLIDRRGSVADRRVVNATLTDEGMRAARQASQLYEDALRDYLFPAVTAADLSAVAAMMRSLSETHRADSDYLPEWPVAEFDPTQPDRRSHDGGSA